MGFASKMAQDLKTLAATSMNVITIENQMSIRRASLTCALIF